jgi:hypothetical protein
LTQRVGDIGCAGERDTPANVEEITPAMIEAGVDAYFAWEDSDEWRATDLARRMFLAMVAARRECLPSKTPKSLEQA